MAREKEKTERQKTREFLLIFGKALENGTPVKVRYTGDTSGTANEAVFWDPSGILGKRMQMAASNYEEELNNV